MVIAGSLELNQEPYALPEYVGVVANVANMFYMHTLLFVLEH